MNAIRDRVEQEEPVVQGIDRSSSSNSSVRSASGSAFDRLKKWGYSIFSMNLSATLRDSEVEDIRISHRRRGESSHCTDRAPAVCDSRQYRISKGCNCRLQDAWYGAAWPHLFQDGSCLQLVGATILPSGKGCWGTGRCPTHISWGRQDQRIEDLCCIYCLGRWWQWAIRWQTICYSCFSSHSHEGEVGRTWWTPSMECPQCRWGGTTATCLSSTWQKLWLESEGVGGWRLHSGGQRVWDDPSTWRLRLQRCFAIPLERMGLRIWWWQGQHGPREPTARLSTSLCQGAVQWSLWILWTRFAYRHWTFETQVCQSSNLSSDDGLTSGGKKRGSICPICPAMQWGGQSICLLILVPKGRSWDETIAIQLASRARVQVGKSKAGTARCHSEFHGNYIDILSTSFKYTIWSIQSILYTYILCIIYLYLYSIIYIYV